jgi:DNA-binding SARP family transcriptional activator
VPLIEAPQGEVDMNTLRIRLFGKFQAERAGRALGGLDALKVQELLCYLLLNRDRPHHREALAGLLWGDTSTSQSKKYLRQALWQIQLALGSGSDRPPGDLLVIDPDWVSIVSSPDLWLDVRVFDEALARVRGIPGQALETTHVEMLEEAVQLYRGDLLEGWYQDWCLYERERLQNVYLDMLDKLMAYCEAHQQYEAGTEYGAKILRYDRARERTHWRLMRLHYLAGDRAGALRQYERCVAALDQELGVKPSQRTVALCEQIRADIVVDLAFPPDTRPERQADSTALLSMLEHLKALRATLDGLQHQVDQELGALEEILSRSR